MGMRESGLNFMIIITRNEWQTTEVWLLLPNYYRKKKQAESQIETIIESNNSRNLLNDSTTRRKREKPGLTDVWNQSFS